MQSSDFIGIDVAKATLEIATADATSPTQTITNDRTAISTWLATLPATAQLALESTGRYHELAVELAGGRGLRVYLVNPRALHHYAKAVHRGAKTDRLDARLIARYLAPRARPAASLHAAQRRVAGTAAAAAPPRPADGHPHQPAPVARRSRRLSQ